MSMHTKEYLFDNIRVGNVQGLLDANRQLIPGGTRTPAWWFNQQMELDRIAAGVAPSHYAAPLPISMIRSELFGWEALDGIVKMSVELRIPGDHPLSKTPGKEEIRQVEFTVPEYKGVIREDKLIECYLNDKLAELGPETVMNVASKSFNTASFQKVLVDNTIEIVGGGDNMLVTGAGVLKWGKVGYIEVSIPEDLQDDRTGIAFRPNLLGSTSFDGSVGTRWDKTITNVVCDNTHQWALSESSDKTGSFKIKRTSNFVERLSDARKALGLLEQGADEYTKILHEWSAIDVSPKQFIKWLDVIIPVPEMKTTQKEVMVSIQGQMVSQTVDKLNTNSHTIAMNKRDRLSELYYSDPRVAPWTGTKLGVAQAANTWARYDQKMKGAKSYDGNVLQARVEGQMMKVLDMSFQKQDVEFLDALDKVLREFDAEGVTIPLASDKPVAVARKRATKADQQNAANN